MFNTFGNLEIDSRAGILLPDFGRGRALAVTGNATVTYDEGRVRRTTLAIQSWTEIPLPILETVRELSSFNPQEESGFGEDAGGGT